MKPSKLPVFRMIPEYSRLSLLRIVFCLIVPIFVIPLSANAANKIVDEDFESISISGNFTCVPEVNPTGSGEISESARPFHNECDANCNNCDVLPAGALPGAFLKTGGNPGQYARAHIQEDPISGNSYSEPKWRLDNKIGGGREIYLKFDLRIDSNLGDHHGTREMANFKLIMITSHDLASSGASLHWHPQLNFEPGGDAYSWYTWSQGGCYGEYYFSRATTKLPNHLMDNQWHTIEVYINIRSHVAADRDDPNSDGIVMVWEDGVKIIEDNSVPMRCSNNEGQEINSMAFIRHAKSLGAPVAGMSGNLYFDNIEVWDGMPGSAANNPANSNLLDGGSSGCFISTIADR